MWVNYVPPDPLLLSERVRLLTYLQKKTKQDKTRQKDDRLLISVVVVVLEVGLEGVIARRFQHGVDVVKVAPQVVPDPLFFLWMNYVPPDPLLPWVNYVPPDPLLPTPLLLLQLQLLLLLPLLLLLLLPLLLLLQLLLLQLQLLLLLAGLEPAVQEAHAL